MESFSSRKDAILQDEKIKKKQKSLERESTPSDITDRNDAKSGLETNNIELKKQLARQELTNLIEETHRSADSQDTGSISVD